MMMTAMNEPAAAGKTKTAAKPPGRKATETPVSVCHTLIMPARSARRNENPAREKLPQRAM